MLTSKTKKSAKWIAIIGGIIAVIVIIVIIFGPRFGFHRHPAITMVRTESAEPFHVDIAWEDEEPNQVYTVFWSNISGIKIHKPETYRRSQTVAGTRLRIYAPYKFVYFVVAKATNKTKEFEAPVMQDDSFCNKNLNPRLLKRDNPMTISVKVLEDAEKYRLYYVKSNGETLSHDIYVKDSNRVQLSLQLMDDTMIFISMIRNGRESEPEFLLYDEKISLPGVKWPATTIRLC